MDIRVIHDEQANHEANIRSKTSAYLWYFGAKWALSIFFLFSVIFMIFDNPSASKPDLSGLQVIGRETTQEDLDNMAKFIPKEKMSMADKFDYVIVALVGFAALMFWLKDIKGYKNRRRRYGYNWKFYKDALIRELIVVALIIIVIIWLFI